jgi:hypothetical protein
MQRLVLFILLAGVLFGCADDDPDVRGLPGIWVQIAFLADPGDGSGTFQPVNTDFTLEINSDLSYTANASLCNNEPTDGTQTTGQFDEATMRVQEEGCQYSQAWELDGNELIIYYPCIEPCAAKFARVSG